MSDKLAKLLDLELAWKRAKADLQYDVFIKIPHKEEIIEADLNNWLGTLKDSINDDDNYTPSPAYICDVPKKNGAIRPGTHLKLNDRVVYAACLGICIPYIHKTLYWAREVDFSYQLSSNPYKPNWISNPYSGWSKFREKSLDKISEGVSYVLIADIAAYYENIDISTLVSDLKQIGVPDEAVSMLSRCLNKWAQVTGKGIPQGHTPSNILGKLYLNSIDHILKNMGYCHYRYVDDIRIFCRSLTEAKKALVDLIRLLRKRGLNIQTAKSKIYRADRAKNEIEGVTTVITAVRDKIIEEAIAITGEDNPYMTISSAETILPMLPIIADDPPIELVREIYKTYFIDLIDDNFDKTLFRFLLKRLARRNDNYVLDHCKDLLLQHPEETIYILDYIKALDVVDEVKNAIVNYLESEDAVYMYQKYLIIDWFVKVTHTPTEELLAIVRNLAFDTSQPPYLRYICIDYLGEYGPAADLERLQNTYDTISDPIEQFEIICSLRRMERGRRNTFLGRVQTENELNKLAVNWVRSRSE